MELLLQYPFYFLITIFFFIIYQFKSVDKNKNLPPQPWKLPIIGHMHHVGTQPHKTLKKLAEKLGPIFHLQLGEIKAIVISSPSVAKEIMKTNDLCFANRPNLLVIQILAYNVDVAFSPYGDYWRQMRKICVLELLSAKKVQSFRSVREQESWKLVEFITKLKSKNVNLSDKIFGTTNTVVCKVVVGNKCKDQEKLIELLNEFISLTSGFVLSDLFPSIKILPLITGTKQKVIKLRDKMDVIFDSIISDHEEQRKTEQKNNDDEDLLEVLLRIKNDGGFQFPITNYNIKAIMLDMFAAGTDTSSVATEWAMSELIRSPRVMKKAQAEVRQVLKGKTKIHESDIQDLVYLKLVIKETLRLHPPSPLLLPRECREKCEISGYEIPVKTQVIINTWKMGRDPEYWVDPESFMPERFSDNSISMMGTDFEYLPFGSGRRMCPGMSLGLANVELPLATLLYHFDWKLPMSDQDLDMSEQFGTTLKRKHDLILVPTPYDTNSCV
ncbi:premnaspirodiene oxygenase-like [Rutidosis leptorrhynchoides]|uniref:premnaspirodiene oxygenase-like n=1 Tax=Rutidosis leptorrhynchoides TaxID=125765 RepID=UPI003A9A5B69